MKEEPHSRSWTSACGFKDLVECLVGEPSTSCGQYLSCYSSLQTSDDDLRFFFWLLERVLLGSTNYK